MTTTNATPFRPLTAAELEHARIEIKDMSMDCLNNMLSGDPQVDPILMDELHGRALAEFEAIRPAAVATLPATTRMTPLVNAAVRVNSLDSDGVVMAMGDHGTAWVRLGDGTQEQFLIEDLTVMTPGVTSPRATLPATPAKIVLTHNAKRALTTAEQFIPDGPWCVTLIATTIDQETHRELSTARLIDPAHTVMPVAPNRWCYPLTENGLRMRAWLRHQFNLGQLAKQVRAENITGEDLADLAAGIDAGEETGTITGTSIDFQLAFALAASLSDQSAQDLREDLEAYLGWAE